MVVKKAPPRKTECRCGCGEMTSSDFAPGHDSYILPVVLDLHNLTTVDLCRIYGFGPGGRNAKELYLSR